MIFRNAHQAIEDHSRVHIDSGSPDRVLYSPTFDSAGHMELKEVGKESLYDFIQSHKESCDINVILARFSAGDTTALAKRQMFYADLTDFPTTYADVVNTMHGAEDYFTGLPVEVRAKFGHDFNRFLAALDNPQTFVDLGIISSPSPDNAPPAPDPNSPPTAGSAFSTTVEKPVPTEVKE